MVKEIFSVVFAVVVQVSQAKVVNAMRMINRQVKWNLVVDLGLVNNFFCNEKKFNALFTIFSLQHVQDRVNAIVENVFVILVIMVKNANAKLIHARGMFFQNKFFQYLNLSSNILSFHRNEDDQMCSGHGSCECNKCKCFDRWSGEDCSCSEVHIT